VPENKNSTLRYGLYAAVAEYLAIWSIHLYTATKALRGFFGDGSLAFLVYLSNSYVFNKPGHWVQLFSVGFPRDFQMLLNALGLQLALWFEIRDPDTLKYIFNFWQFALPGFLYIGLCIGLWRKGYASWAVFPLISWAILSVPVDWTAPNSTRWAIPIFWMHFMVVILSGPKIRAVPAMTVILLGIGMLGGLYESVVLHCALCLGLGALFWIIRKNYVPLIYGAAAIPGACRAALTYLDNGHSAPNSFSHLALPTWYLHSSFYFLIVLTLAIIVAIGTGKISSRYLGIGLFLLLIPAVNVLILPIPNVWTQIDMRFDYVFISLALMSWAGLLRLMGAVELKFASSAAIIALLTGSILWITQIQGTLGMWESCRAQRLDDLRGQTLDIAGAFRPLFANDRPISSLPQRACAWDWAQPWTDLLFANHGQVETWSLQTFWQDFSFIEKDGSPFLHTNNWTLNSPSMQESSEDIPLQTLLFDLTPLYKKLGDGPLATRISCMPADRAGSYWRANLLAMDDTTRAKMFVCPAHL